MRNFLQWLLAKLFPFRHEGVNQRMKRLPKL
jgi:hypothetical protein